MLLVQGSVKIIQWIKSSFLNRICICKEQETKYEEPLGDLNFNLPYGVHIGRYDTKGRGDVTNDLNELRLANPWIFAQKETWLLRQYGMPRETTRPSTIRTDFLYLHTVIRSPDSCSRQARDALQLCDQPWLAKCAINDTIQCPKWIANSEKF